MNTGTGFEQFMLPTGVYRTNEQLLPHLISPAFLSSRHLQDTLGSLQVENKYLRVRTHEQHHKGEQIKVSRTPAPKQC